MYPSTSKNPGAIMNGVRLISVHELQIWFAQAFGKVMVNVSKKFHQNFRKMYIFSTC